MPVTPDPVEIACVLNGTTIPFQLDSGASISTISYYDASKVNSSICKSSKRVQAYNGDSVDLIGETMINVSYNDCNFLHKFFVVSNNKVNLLGRDLISKMHIQLLLPDTINSTNDVLSDFQDYLSDSFDPNIQETVHLDVMHNAIPTYSKARQVPIKLRDKLSEELNRLAQEGKITKIFKSKWASPIVTVFKQNGSIRLCGDYSATVNKFLEPVQTPLPTVDEVISQIGRASIFSKIDLSQAFLQLPLDEASKQYTVINTPDGLYQYNYLPFGLTSSPGIFQSFMTRVLANIKHIIVYQDDILILSPDKSSHLKTLQEVLTTLKETGIKINESKCKFLCSEIKYLGHIFDRNGVHPNRDKIKSILDAPSPVNVKQVQAFLGLCNYYSRFIHNFADTMAPLYSLLQKNCIFKWESTHEDCFRKVKKLFENNNVLQHYDPNAELMLETDASSYGLGSVLLQRHDSKSPWLPVQFASRTLNPAERNYSNIEREALSVVFGLDKFRHFLLGSKFIIANDHKPLHNLFAKNQPVPNSGSARIQRWALKLSQYNYEFVYSKGSDNVHSDCLSRLPLSDTVTESEPYEIVSTLQNLESDYISCKDIKIHTDSDPDLVTLKQYIKTGFPNRVNNPVVAKFKSMFPNLSIARGCIMFQNRVFIPQSLRKPVLDIFHENHPGVVGMKSLARSLIWYPGLDGDIASLVLNCKICQSVRSKPPASNIKWPVASRPWSRIHVDHFFFENVIFFLVIDSLTKYIEVEIVKATSVSETIDALSTVFARHGLPDVLVSDNASCFTAFDFKSFLNRNGIEHITPPPYSPASNGQAEGGVRVIKNMLKKCSGTDSMKYRLAKVMLQYRTVPHNTTQIAPSIALNTRKLITLKDRINPKFCSKIDLNQNVIPQFEIGDSVLVLNLREGKKWYRGSVVEKLGINVYKVFVNELDSICKRHANQLIAIPDNPEELSEEDSRRDEPNFDVNVRRSNRVSRPPNRLSY